MPGVNSISLSFVGLALLVGGCVDKEAQLEPRFVSVFNDDTVLNQRISSPLDTLEVEGEGLSGGRKEVGFALVLEKRLESPVVDGQTLQATSVSYNSGKLLVSYNFRGEKYYGGAEFLTDQFKLTSQILYHDADINAVVSDELHAYLAGAVEGYEVPAQVLKVGIQGYKFLLDQVSVAPLGSFAATSLQLIENEIIVTTGDESTSGGGIYHLDNSLAVKGYYPLHDARWVTEYQNRLYVAQGTPGKITVLDKAGLTELFSFEFKGADVAASKTTIEVVDDRVFIAGGSQGVQVHAAADGKFLHSLSFEEGHTTNAVSAEDGLLFISNGEGGLHVASYTDTVSEAPKLIGKILFGEDSGSVNHVLHRNKNLYVATGLGGIKMISVRK